MNQIGRCFTGIIYNRGIFDCRGGTRTGVICGVPAVRSNQTFVLIVTGLLPDGILVQSLNRSYLTKCAVYLNRSVRSELYSSRHNVSTAHGSRTLSQFRNILFLSFSCIAVRHNVRSQYYYNEAVHRDPGPNSGRIGRLASGCKNDAGIITQMHDTTSVVQYNGILSSGLV